MTTPGRPPPERDFKSEKIVRRGARRYELVGKLGTGKTVSVPLGPFVSPWAKP